MQVFPVKNQTHSENEEAELLKRYTQGHAGLVCTNILFSHTILSFHTVAETLLCTNMQDNIKLEIMRLAW